MSLPSQSVFMDIFNLPPEIKDMILELATADSFRIDYLIKDTLAKLPGMRESFYDINQQQYCVDSMKNDTWFYSSIDEPGYNEMEARYTKLFNAKQELIMLETSVDKKVSELSHTKGLYE